MRQPGYYWVRSNDGPWLIAELIHSDPNGEHFAVFGAEDYYGFDIVGPEVVEPEDLK